MLTNSKWKISSRWKRFQRAKLWQSASKGQVKLFTYFVVGLILCVTILQLTLVELDKREADQIGRERDQFIQRHTSPSASISSKAHSDNLTSGVNSVVEDFLQRFKYNHTSNGSSNSSSGSANKKSGPVKRQVKEVASVATPKPRNNQPKALTTDPFEVSESQFVVYRESHRTLGRANDSAFNPNSGDDVGMDAAAAAASTTQTNYVTSSQPPTIDVSFPIAVNRAIGTNRVIHMKENNNNQATSIPTAATTTTESTTTPETLLDATTAGAIAGAFVGEHLLSQFERNDDEPTATGTSQHRWAGRPVDPQPETVEVVESTNDRDVDNSDDIPPSYTSKLQRSASDNGDVPTSTMDSMPDSIESLMGSDEKGDAIGNSDDGAGQANQPQTSNKIQARSLAQLSNEHISNQGIDQSENDEDEADSYADLDSSAPNDAMRTKSSYNNQAALQSTGNHFLGIGPTASHDLSAAAGHHYGKKKKKIIVKKKKKKKQVYKVKKVKKIKKKVIKKKKREKKIVIIKKKKKVKKHKKKKKKKHYKPDHGKYYIYAKVPKKKSWEFGFKKGNKKHWIERHEKGHKNKFKTKVKWFDKKSKGKGVHIWDYNHHDKKKHHG